MRARSPRASARPRAVLASRVRAGALLISSALHRSLWQHVVADVPLLTWLGALKVGVHESAQSFSTRFPDRGSTGATDAVTPGSHL